MIMTRLFGGLRMHRVVTPPAERDRVQEERKADEARAQEPRAEPADDRKAA
ncbi:MAG: hypothetical protein ACRDN9_13785 [Streptosporangiaceae bacterium]